MLSVTGIVAIHGQTSNIEKSISYVPPTHMNLVNPPSSSGQPLGAQPVTNQTSWGYGVDVIVTSKCIHLYFLCILTQCLFQDVFVMYLSNFMP